MKQTIIKFNKDLQKLDAMMNHYGHNISIISEPNYCTECEVYLKGLEFEEGDYGTDDPL